jgi:hypothetical protein
VCCSRFSPGSGIYREPCVRREVFPSDGTACGDDRAWVLCAWLGITREKTGLA